MRPHPAELAAHQERLLEGTCAICRQPECAESSGGARPGQASHSTRLAPGERDARGYGEWAVHPEEAIFVLHRGYALVDGLRRAVAFIQNEAFVTMIRVDGTHAAERPSDHFVDAAFTGERILVPVEEAAA